MLSSGSRRNSCSAHCCLALFLAIAEVVSAFSHCCVPEWQFCWITADSLAAWVCLTSAIKIVSSKRYGKEIWNWKCEIQTGKRERIWFQRTESNAKPDKLFEMQIQLLRNDCVFCWHDLMEMQECHFESYFSSFQLTSHCINDLWMWLEDGTLWVCLTAEDKELGKMYLCSKVCWIRSRIKRVTEKATKHSRYLGFQQWCWGMAAHKMGWNCWG